MRTLAKPCTSLVEGDDGLYLPNCQSNLVIALDALFCIFINTTAYHWADMSQHLPQAIILPGLANAFGRTSFLTKFISTLYETLFHQAFLCLYE